MHSCAEYGTMWYVKNWLYHPTLFYVQMCAWRHALPYFSIPLTGFRVHRLHYCSCEVHKHGDMAIITLVPPSHFFLLMMN